MSISDSITTVEVLECVLVSALAWRRRWEALQPQLAAYFAALVLLAIGVWHLPRVLVHLAHPASPHFRGIGRVVLHTYQALDLASYFAFSAIVWHAYVRGARVWLVPTVIGAVWFVVLVGTYGLVPSGVTDGLQVVAPAFAALLELAAFALAWRNPTLDLRLGHRVILFFIATDVSLGLMRLFGATAAWRQQIAINLITFALVAGSYALEPATATHAGRTVARPRRD